MDDDLFDSITVRCATTASNSSKTISVNPGDDPLNLFKKLIKLMFVNSLYLEHVHKGVRCDSCNKESFEGFRFKCLECQNFDLCSKCYDIQNSGKKHNKIHAMIMFKRPITPKESQIYESLVGLGLEKLNQIVKGKEIVHREVSCNGCKIKPIMGLRFKCDECYDFDYCFECFKSKKKTETHDPKNHKMLVSVNYQKVKFSFDDIALEEKLGKGCFGEVYKAKILPLNNKICACKLFFIDSILKEYNKKGQVFDQNVIMKSFLNELNSLNEVRSPNLIDYYGYGMDIEAKGSMKIFLLFEYMPNGSLEAALRSDSKLNGQLSLRRRFQLALDIISGIRRFHSKKLIHKDIKPDNILISGGIRAKIGDLGVSKLMNSPNQLISDNIAPRDYRAPDEILTPAFDIYSFGLVLNHIFTGEKHEGFLGFHHVRRFSEYFGNLIKQCLSKKANERPTAQKIEFHFEKFDAYFWENVGDKMKYIQLDNINKNEMFKTILKEFELKNKF